MRTIALLLAIAVATASSAARGAEAGDESAVIQQRVEAYVAAYNQHDAAALADLWAADAVYVNHDTGEQVTGRDAIRDMFADMFDGGDASQLAVVIESIRLITPDVAIEDGVAEISAADGDVTSTAYTAIHVKQDGAWYLNSVRETDMPAPPSKEPSELDQLAWLIGEWADEADDATTHSQWRWTPGGHFLINRFGVSVDQQIEIEGTQVIGWDPVAGQIRSWVFDSQGGFGEGVWRRVGDQWIVDMTSTLSDGSQGSASNIYVPLDENSFAWRSVDRQIDGEPLGDVEEVVVHRQVPAAETTDGPPEPTSEGGN